ncbi:MAG: UDP-N-acetylmuramate dehydrogenase [Thermoleophilia bacterium]
MPLRIRHDVPLAPMTTLQTGGPARFFLEAQDEAVLVEGLAWARERGLPVVLLGGGSNVLVADTGVDGLVIKMATRGVALDADGDSVVVRTRAGETWDELVERTVGANLAGLECLSGIPGSVGAAPVQNIGAYGQEAADTLLSVRVIDLRSLLITDLTSAQCAFAYRDSRFRRHPEEYGVLEVSFGLRPDGLPTVSYPDLAQELAHSHPTLAQTREAVLHVRRRKSMIIDPSDENRRSVGSFFTNPRASTGEFDALAAQAERAGLARRDEIPRYPDGPDRVKLSAAWLIERAGVMRGYRVGRVGVSTRHTLALVNLGGASTSEVVSLAMTVRRAVAEAFGIDLAVEPVCLGFQPPWQRRRPEPASRL